MDGAGVVCVLTWHGWSWGGLSGDLAWMELGLSVAKLAWMEVGGLFPDLAFM